MLKSSKIVSISAQIIVHAQSHILRLTFYGKKFLSSASSLFSMEKLRSTAAVVGGHLKSKQYTAGATS